MSLDTRIRILWAVFALDLVVLAIAALWLWAVL